MEEKVFEILEDICEEDLRETPDINIFEDGLMDSLSLVRFIVEVEEKLGISLGIMEIDKEVTNTPNKIIEFLKNRM
ncbi:MAG: D-alanine--poly(phosphoribitol) ligase subunit DltC [Peptoniphilaceae bacterium]|uniref:D-alanine--poly(phosphoribitol) ligase subunit DltC n=1 Tax=Parvimonas sp. TaxID=1944660 RepID=UPI0025F85A2C|nr:D-alanine--poly(phosphoribitol) ligase subunit DltC [Parvimonas sp.]MCI5997708.1 D-alanine--poly(phosphoribitol) ligase subunit DltC [Parvimonas sp.]MDD7765562.1 D-alanine--poly(phosphoribitol) ligase subunit DltC [Peptoniphilaceae bacterium]MDY3051103.1 D-alanine--poly(phosphoribitol) ligase subunit DltC [Parvimonas sp.]